MGIERNRSIIYTYYNGDL